MSVPPESSITAIVPSGTPSVRRVITVSTSPTKRAVPLMSALALKTFCPVPTISLPCSSVGWLPEFCTPAPAWYFSGSSWRETTADIWNR